MSKLVAALGNPNDPRPTRVTVINVNMVNAFALPGGKIVVMAKLLDLMETPDELAAVLAHEIGHVAERHPTEAALRATGFSMFLTMLVGDSSWIAEFLAALGVQAVQSSYSREDERTADRIAAALMKAAGADQSALGTVFERLKKVQEGKGVVDLGRLSALLSTHPSYDDRIANARAETGAAARPLLSDEARPLLSDEEWQALKGICADAGPEPASDGSDEVGDQAVDVGGFFHVNHVPGALQHVAAGAVG
jgi:predicted Zn-dependent protease